jgi:hypothetical protein
MTDKEIDVEILSISHDNSKGDILCYIYADNNLLDAVTLTEDLYEPAVTTLQSVSDQVIQIVAKDLLRSQPIGTVQFRLGLLLESKNTMTLPMSTNLVDSIPDEVTKPYINLKWYPKDSSSKNQLFYEPSDNNEVLKSMQNELEIEKWKNSGLKQLREEINSSEIARLTAMHKLQGIVDDYEKEIQVLKKQIGLSTYEQVVLQQKQAEEEYLKIVNEWKNKEKDYIENISMLEEEKLNKDIEISKLKAEGQLIKLELEACKNVLKLEKIKKDQNSEEELLLKIKILEDEIEEKQRELEINKKITNEALEQLSHFQVHNTFLRSHIESIEHKMQNLTQETSEEISQLVQYHLEAMSIPIKAIQVTENIFKIGNETIHLFFDKNELMVQQGGKTLLFVDWLQRNQWKTFANHKRSKSEENKNPCKETNGSLDPCLDTVLEVENEHEDEPAKKNYTPVKNSAAVKVKKSPSGKIIRSYSPILSKKKANK